jgi:hypothetical protein
MCLNSGFTGDKGMGEIIRGQVFGMRCSGTNHLDALVRANFPGLHMLPTHDTELRQLSNLGWKHGGLGSRSFLYRGNQLVSNQTLPFNAEVAESTLLMVAYRSPFAWLRSLQQQPHHALKLYPDVADFRTFLTSPWEAYASPPDEHFELSRAERELYIALGSLFELFPSVLAKRRAKVQLFEDLRQTPGSNVSYVNHEQLTNPTGAAAYLGELSSRYGIPRMPKFVPIGTHKGYTSQPYQKRDYPPLAPEDLAHILGAHDWDAEAEIGYVLSDRAHRTPLTPAICANPDKLLHFTLMPRHYGGTQV